LKLKIFTLPFKHAHNGFDDTAIQEFIADKEVMEATDHFFIHEKLPYLKIFISYRDIQPDEKRRSGGRIIGKRKEDPASQLDEIEKEIYNQLRTWRAAQAKHEGVPAYIIATNKQLAKMVKSGIAAKSDLGKIDGFGEIKRNNLSNQNYNDLRP